MSADFVRSLQSWENKQVAQNMSRARRTFGDETTRKTVQTLAMPERVL